MVKSYFLLLMGSVSSILSPDFPFMFVFKERLLNVFFSITLLVYHVQHLDSKFIYLKIMDELLCLTSLNSC